MGSSFISFCELVLAMGINESFADQWLSWYGIIPGNGSDNIGKGFGYLRVARRQRVLFSIPKAGGFVC